jgi:hypothetical protein
MVKNINEEREAVLGMTRSLQGMIAELAGGDNQMALTILEISLADDLEELEDRREAKRRAIEDLRENRGLFHKCPSRISLIGSHARSC